MERTRLIKANININHIDICNGMSMVSVSYQWRDRHRVAHTAGEVIIMDTTDIDEIRAEVYRQVQEARAILESRGE